MKPQAKLRENYPFIFPIQTRWSDNDIYGHVNSVNYYSFFDSAVNALLIKKAHFDIHRSKIIGLVVSSSCQFLQELCYPEVIEVGVAIKRMGNSSLEYDLAIFKANQNTAAAQGQFIHVFVDREQRKSTPIPMNMRQALQAFMQVEPEPKLI